MREFLLEYWKYGVWILFGSGFIFEIIPIKFSPISAILKWIGKRLNKDIETKLNEVTAKVDILQTDLQDHKVESWRRDLLDFSNSIMLGKCRTKEDFDNIIGLHSKYDKYIKERGIDNGQIDLAFEYISNTYYDCMKNNNFYTGE